ncbi:FK506-binding protein 15 [Bagarius yarrelli]|uniref:peptidylprolyl isomerase n=1 Tax=Bagarius yarrelli TaxID=175774 RepID=A0A556VCQ7_BAGYA|nr:FK506-binding protein 15 [Bagarius yarrelli]
MRTRISASGGRSPDQLKPEAEGKFSFPSSAKLASLFSLDQTSSQANESFQYTAPKQPRKSSGPSAQKAAPPPGSPAVLFATAVHAYRYVNGQYVKQGKLGAAVLGNHANKEYKLLLYASQQKPVTASRIHSSFSFTVQPSNYCTFYDDQRQNWSLMFESEKAATDFCKEVRQRKNNHIVCLSGQSELLLSLEMLLTQDLLLGEGQAVEFGDSLEVAYTGWLLQNHSIGQMFDSNVNKEKLLRMKLGTGKVIKGWEEGMLNMRKGGRRLLIIPPALAYGAQGVPGRVPADSTLVFETEIRRVKFAKDGGSERTAVGSRDTAVPSPAPSVESLGPDPTSAASKSGEPPLRAKSNSLSEQLANPDATKAKLISRMAKMGQPMLPFLAGSASSPSQAESSDSELEDPNVSRLKERPPAPSPQPVHLTSRPPASLQAAALMPVSMATAGPQPVIPVTGHGFQPYSYPQSTMASSHLQPVAQIYSHTVPYQGSGDVTSFLMTEARQHNTEIRLAVSKVGDKVDHLAAKVEELHKQGGLSLGLSNVSMDTAMIMNTIQRIIQENECLKKEVFEKSARVEEQNRKIGELINQNQSGSDSFLFPECTATGRGQDPELQLELTAQRQKAASLQSSLSAALQEGQQQSTKLTALETQLQEMKEAAEQVQAQYKAEKQRRRELELKLSNLEEELQDLKSEKESLERTLLDRKKKWLAERQRCDEELEEVRKTSQMEMDQLRNQLRKARTNTGQAAAEQLAQLQADLEREWQAKCERALALAREQQNRDFSAIKQSREKDEQRLLQQQDQGEELQALRDKCCELEKRAESLRQQGEEQVAELERRLAERQQPTDTTGEVKRVMNGVFHSLRAEFELNETYTGSVVLGVLVNTIKNVTLKLLSKAEPSLTANTQKKEEVKEELEKEQMSKEHVNGKKEEEEKKGEKEEEDEQGKMTGEKDREERKDRQEVVKKLKQKVVNVKKNEEEKVEQEVVSAEEVEQEVVSAEEVEQEVVSTKKEIYEEEEVEQEVVSAKEEINEEEEVEQEVVSAKEEIKGEKEIEGTQEELRVTGEKPGGLEPDSDTRLKPVTSDITTPNLTQNDVTPKEEVNAGPSADITPEEEIVAESEDTGCLSEESEPHETVHTGPPKNPPPPPPPPQDSTETAARTSSPSEGANGVNSEESFFQSPTLNKPPPLPSTDEDEEEEELSLKGRPPPTPLFGDDSDDDDDLDWLS